MESFSVYWWPDDGSDHYICEAFYTSPRAAMESAKRLIRGPVAKLGMIKRVMITDSDDCCNFEWTREDGVIFPKKEDLKPNVSEE